MEGYIQKLNDKALAKGDKHAKKVKLTYQVVGGLILGIGLAGFVACFITFMVLFFNFQTDEAMTAWIIAVPFLILLVPGSVLTRIGDAMVVGVKKKDKDNKD